MMALLSDPLAFTAYFFLTLALLSFWVKQKPALWLCLLALATGAFFLRDRLSMGALFVEAVFGLACHKFYRGKLNKSWKLVLGALILAIAAGLTLHKIPGFMNWLLIPTLYLSPDSIPFRVYLNFDKALIGIFLIGWGYKTIQSKKEWIAMLKSTAPIAGAASLVLLGPALYFNFVHLDLKWFDFSPEFLFVNLVFTCVVEEALFRGFVQVELVKVFGSFKISPYLSWITTSALFGIAHIQGGLTYALLAMVAGLFYGFAFLKTKRIEASILTHFVVNALHFLCFSYPGLK